MVHIHEKIPSKLFSVWFSVEEPITIDLVTAEAGGGRSQRLAGDVDAYPGQT